jgi:formylglycine-generating enzyme required for sulfatase activity
MRIFLPKDDIAISVAEEDLPVASQIADALAKRNIRYYLYTEHRARNWGKHILKICLDAFDADALFVLMITSSTYVGKYWTGIESQIAGISKKSSRNYILQLRIDNTPVDGLSKYVLAEDWKDNAEEIAQILEEKLRYRKQQSVPHLLTNWKVTIPVLILMAILAYWIYNPGTKVPIAQGPESQQYEADTLSKPQLVNQPRKNTREQSQSPLTKNTDGLQRVAIPSASFIIGNDKRREDSPTHTVRLEAFYISQTEVTVAQYKEYCRQQGKPLPRLPYTGDYDKYPIVNVTWQEALDYCKWAGGRLPTEAEWEFAAGAGLTTKYAGGNNAGLVAVYGNQKPSSIRRKKNNDFDLYDMTGNAAEWCSDWYEPGYPPGEASNPKGPASGTEKVIRGGSCTSKISPVNQLHITYRDKQPPDSRSPLVGFRVVWDVTAN